MYVEFDFDKFFLIEPQQERASEFAVKSIITI